MEAVVYVPESPSRRIWQSVRANVKPYVLIAAIGTVLTLPSLRAGLLFDDYHVKLLMANSDSPLRLLNSPLDMFRLLDGNPVQNKALMDYGFLPWWTDEAVKAAFWRPVASVTHWADYLLWPDSPAMMHLQSVLWYAMLAGAVTLLYQRIMGLTTVAIVAAFLYCVDDAHVVPVGFLANRNAVLAALFGVLALLAHDRWRRSAWRWGIVAGPAMLALSLLSKEEGIATVAYLAAFALLMDTGSLRKRLLSLAPYALVIVVWRICWSQLGYGVAHIGPYVDPLREPLRYGASLLTNAPILLMGQLAAPPADLSLILQSPMLRWFGAIAWVFVILVAAAWMPLLRRDRIARFWALGMVLCLIPLCTTFPADRMLLFVGLGAMGLMAQFLQRILTSPLDWPQMRIWRITVLILAGIFVVRHGIISPLNLPLRSASPMGPQYVLDRLYLKQPPIGSQDQDVIILNAPTIFCVMTSPLIWASDNAPMPKHMRVLSSSLFQPVDVYRTDAQTLVVRPTPGFLAWMDDRLCRGEDRPMTLGQTVELTGMSVEVAAMTWDGRPAEAVFRFDKRLEDPSLRWLQWKDGGFVPFTPPAIGESVTVKASWKSAFL